MKHRIGCFRQVRCARTHRRNCLFRSTGFCAKFIYEAIEEIDETQVEAVTATGADRAQILNYGVVLQILPAFAGISVFLWDRNIREATVVGLVGASRSSMHRSWALAGPACP